MADLIIRGRPLATFETTLASWNDAIAKANMRPKRVKSHAQSRFMFTEFQRMWREHGYNMAKDFMNDVWWLGQEQPHLVAKRAMVIVKVVRNTLRTYDVHNAYCKAVFDGFSDAGIWRDDSWQYVPWVLYGWVHMDDLDSAFYEGNVFIIEVYELDRVIFNNQPYILPDWSEYETDPLRFMEASKR